MIIIRSLSLFFVTILLIASASAEGGEGGGGEGEDTERGHEGAASSVVNSRSSTRFSKPVWEVGVGAGYISGYDYPASNDVNKRFVALPFFVYRTSSFRLGDGGVRAVAIERPRIKLDLSVGGSLNASSTGNSIRDGMPDLDYLFEIGPQLEMRWFDRKMPSGGRLLGRISSELRAVFATDFKSVDFQGVVAEAGAGVFYRHVRGSKIDLFSALNLTYADERMQDYFYQVDEVYELAERPSYDADGGFLQTRLVAGLALQPLKNVRLFLAASTGLFNGASNEQSPLFETRHSTGLAAGLVWTIKTSDRRVDIVELGANN